MVLRQQQALALALDSAEMLQHVKVLGPNFGGRNDGSL